MAETIRLAKLTTKIRGKKRVYRSTLSQASAEKVLPYIQRVLDTNKDTLVPFIDFPTIGNPLTLHRKVRDAIIYYMEQSVDETLAISCKRLNDSTVVRMHPEGVMIAFLTTRSIEGRSPTKNREQWTQEITDWLGEEQGSTILNITDLALSEDDRAIATQLFETTNSARETPITFLVHSNLIRAIK